MTYKLVYAIVAIAIPLVAANYGPAPTAYNLPASSSYGLEELAQAAAGGSQQGASSLTATAEVQPSPSEAARLGQVQAQLQALNANPTYQNLKNSEAIAESLAESNLASNIRQGNVNVVSPNVVDQGVYRSLYVPKGHNNHQVIATQPLPPIIVHQPGGPPAYVSSGPAAVVKAAPVIYKIKPSVIYQQEVINKVPTPLSLNPVYVKVYKPGKKIDAPVAPVVQPAYNQASYGHSHGHGAESYAAPQQYDSQPSYNNAPDYYAPAGYAQPGY